MGAEEFRHSPGDEKPVKRAPVQALKVGFILLPRFTLAPFASILDVLRLAADEGDHSRPITCSWNVMSPSSAPITSSSGVQIIPTSGLLPPQTLHYIVVVGGLLHGDTDLPKSTVKYLQEADRCGVPLIGVCTGSFALMRAGLMQNKKICVSWFHYNDLIDEFPDVTPIADQLFVIDGNRITCAGGAGAIDLGAWLIERHLGPSIAQKSLHIMLVDRARAPDAPQPQPLVEVAKDTRVRRAVLLIEQNIATPLTAAELSERLRISTRQLDRLFVREYKVPVAEFYRRFRAKYGKWLLQNSELSNAQIALDCGFSDYSHFYRVYRSVYGEQPTRR
jgi:transcriptional regulator GlxA family with amidase domain